MDNRIIVKRLWALVKPYRTRAFLALLAMALTAVTNPLLAKALELLMDEGFRGKPGFSLWWIPGVLVMLFVVRGVGTFATAYYNSWVLSRVRMLGFRNRQPIRFWWPSALSRNGSCL